MSTEYGSFSPAQVAWLQYAAQLASSVDAKPFVKSQFEKKVADIRDLAGNEADVRRIPRFLSEIGVRFVLVEKLKGMKLDGATFWLDKKSPVVALSMRYDRIDHFWFVLCHELAHVLYGEGQAFVDDDLVGEDLAEADLPEAERKADEFATELLVPKSELDDFIARIRPLYSRKRIIGFANRVGVHPGIVVGQLQHRKEIGFWHSRPLLPKVTDALAASAMSDGWGHSPA
jgi:HTH-type transcriptional regulator/antitoxin HigA